MFRNGHVFSEILNVSHTPSLQNAALTGQVNKLSDRATQSEVLSLVNTGKVRVPRSTRYSLDITFPYVAFQLFIPSDRALSLEISLLDNSGARHKLVFTQCSEMTRNDMILKVPNDNFLRNKWNNLCIDVHSYVNRSWGSHLDYVESISVIGNCRLRRVFALKFPWKDSDGPMAQQIRHDILPASYEISVPHVNQFITPTSHFESLNTIQPPRTKAKVKPKREQSIFHQEIKVSPEPMLKSGLPGFFEKHFISLTKIRHDTPPFVRL